MSDFIAEAQALTRRGDVPLLPEWAAWAARYGTLHEVWCASRNPEFLIFLLGHAVRQGYLEDREGLLGGLERFVGWCVSNAGLDPEPLRAPDGALVETSGGWFSAAGATPFGRARRAAQVAERAAVGTSGPAGSRELLDERSEQAAVFRLLVGNPFVETHRADDHGVGAACGDGAGRSEESGDDSSGADDGEDDRPDLLLAPAQRGPWGVVTRLSGPPDPPGPPGTSAAALRNADGSLRRGMILLSKKSVEDSVALAEECFRDALNRLISTVGEMHPKVAYACDRIGLVCQIQGRDEEAEVMYLRAIALRDAGTWGHTVWDEVTLLNLAILYSDQGRHGLRDAMLERLDDARHDDGTSGEGDEDDSRDPDQLELA